MTHQTNAGRKLKWEYTQERKKHCAMWKTIGWEILKDASHPHEYDLYRGFSHIQTFRKLSTAKKVAQLIHNG